MTVEQKVIEYLARLGLITNVGEVFAALEDPAYADWLVTGNGLEDEGVVDGECDHEALSNDEIQVVFDNDKQ